MVLILERRFNEILSRSSIYYALSRYSAGSSMCCMGSSILSLDLLLVTNEWS